MTENIAVQEKQEATDSALATTLPFVLALAVLFACDLYFMVTGGSQLAFFLGLFGFGILSTIFYFLAVNTAVKVIEEKAKKS